MGDKIFECEECLYTTCNGSNLIKHMDKHNKITDRKLKKHSKEIHGETTVFKCDFCPYAAARKPHLKRHIKAVHDKIRDNMCGDCGFSTTRKDKLKKHMESVHKIVVQKGLNVNFVIQSLHENTP